MKDQKSSSPKFLFRLYQQLRNSGITSTPVIIFKNQKNSIFAAEKWSRFAG
jgi:hypothetical protein